MNAVQWKAIATVLLKLTRKHNIFTSNVGSNADTIQMLAGNNTYLPKEELVHWIENIDWEENNV